MASKHHSIREKQNKLLPQTHSSKVDYSLFMMVAMVVMSESLEKRPRVTPTAFPPPISARTTSVSLFRVLLCLLKGTPWGSLYSRFGQPEQYGMKMDDIGALRLKRA
jgi:hypothetical protein